MSMPSVSAERTGDRPNFLVPAAAAIGLAVGILFGDPALAFVARMWDEVVLPAYFEMQKSGIPFCS